MVCNFFFHIYIFLSIDKLRAHDTKYAFHGMWNFIMCWHLVFTFYQQFIFYVITGKCSFKYVDNVWMCACVSVSVRATLWYGTRALIRTAYICIHNWWHWKWIGIISLMYCMCACVYAKAIEVFTYSLRTS